MFSLNKYIIRLNQVEIHAKLAQRLFSQIFYTRPDLLCNLYNWRINIPDFQILSSVNQVLY